MATLEVLSLCDEYGLLVQADGTELRTGDFFKKFREKGYRPEKSSTEQMGPWNLTTLCDCGERRERVVGSAGTPAEPRAEDGLARRDTRAGNTGSILPRSWSNIGGCASY